MIFPVLNLFVSFRKAPITWALFFINLLVMYFTVLNDPYQGAKMEGITTDKQFLEIQGSIYQSFLREREGHRLNRELASLVGKDDVQSHQVLGVLAFRDEKFLKSEWAETSFVDEVAFNYWREKLDQFLSDQEQSVAHMMGVSEDESQLTSWITYMFAHGGWPHFFSNMLFLLLVGGTLELAIGSLGLLTVYLFSGFIACAIYILSSGLSASPLVGASGAVSGLITLLAVLNWNSPVRFVYWLLIPQRRAFGFIYLPGAFLFYIWIVADLAGYLSSSAYMGGVAHAAHLGGHLTGAVAGLTLLGIAYFTKRPWRMDHDVKMYELYPFLPDSVPAESRKI